MRAVKGNKEYTIDETQQKFYQDGGFDIVGNDGSILSYGRGKTVPYEDYMNAVREIERLQGMVSDLNAKNEALKASATEPEIAQKEDKKAGAKKAGE